MKRIDSNCGNEGSIDRAISLKRKNLRIQLEMDWINIDSGGGEVKMTSIKDGHLDRKETARLPRLFLFFYLILLASNVDHVEGLPVRPRSSNFNFRHPFPGGCCCCCCCCCCWFHETLERKRAVASFFFILFFHFYFFLDSLGVGFRSSCGQSGSRWVWLRLIQFYPIIFAFYLVLLGFTGFYLVILGFYPVLPSFTRFYLDLIGFT